MIYDCFTFFNELDLLELRLNILNNIVDKFVIVEGTKTFTGQEKTLNFKQNQERFKKFKDKIIYVEHNEYPSCKTPWIYESLQRNAIAQGLIHCNDEDIILISDIDEIIAPEAIKKAIKTIDKGTPIKKFVQYNMSYCLNIINCKEPLWFHPEICTYKNFKNCLDNADFNYNTYCPEEVNQGTTANKIRLYEACDLIENGGWHFSFLGSAEKILYKFKNYSHQELKPHLDSIMQNIAAVLEDINTLNTFDMYRAIDYNILPIYVQNNIEKYKKYLSLTPHDKLCNFNDISATQFTNIKSKFFRYSIQRFLSFGKARKKYKRKYIAFKEKYRILQYYRN